VRFGDYQDQILQNSFFLMRLVTGLKSMSLVMGALLSLTPQLVQSGFLTDHVLFAVLVAVPFDGLVSVLFAVHNFAVHDFAVHVFAVLFAVHVFAVLYGVFVAVLFSVHDFAVHDVAVHVFGVVFLMALPFLELCLVN